MANESIELEGVGELLAKLESMGLNVSKIEAGALKAAAEPIAQDMKSLVNVSDKDHRHIKNDIEISGVKTLEGIKYLTIGPGKATNWRAKFLEWGTSKMAAAPFVQPAGEQNKDTTSNIIAEKIKEGMGI